MKVGHQTYSWEMLGNEWRGSADDILDSVAGAGYAGVEFSNVMIGDYWDRPAAFQSALGARRLELAAFAFAAQDGFTDPACREDDLAAVEKALALAAQFSVPLCLAGPSSPSHDAAEQKLSNAIQLYNEAGRLGKKRGVVVAVHPHSHHTSLVLTADQYDRLLGATEPSGLMFNPDTGHIVRGGQDLLECFRRHRDRIVHVHCKDVDAGGHWQPMGKGVCEFPRLFDWLGAQGYDGWLISEEESEIVRRDLRSAISQNRSYFRSLGY
jgi:inosose dehydratase